MPEPAKQWKFTEAEWIAKGEELFGPDRERWVFRCPACGNEMSIARARAEFPQLRGSGWAPESECIGRYFDVPAAQVARPGVTSRRCDWCAYGLFRGPWVVVRAKTGTETAVFEFGAPRGAEAGELEAGGGI